MAMATFSFTNITEAGASAPICIPKQELGNEKKVAVGAFGLAERDVNVEAGTR
jgi:hypothetical protein